MKNTSLTEHHSTSNNAVDLLRLCPVHVITPLLDLKALASSLGVAMILAKDESQRPLGNFKALGGVYAGLRAIAQLTGHSIAEICSTTLPASAHLTLVCASDGNHGLAVAAAARLAGAKARIFLPNIVPEIRVARITSQGASIIKINGTYDDAVRAASDAARNGEGVLIADTTDRLHDPVVDDVMAGYGVMADEIVSQLNHLTSGMPTHIFVQAGVGGLAAALCTRLGDRLAAPARIVVVEPHHAACVAAALKAGSPVRVEGDLDTSAEMLSCGEASAPALVILRRYHVAAIAVSETALAEAPIFLNNHSGPKTTASGAAGLAGLRTALANPEIASSLQLDLDSRVLLLITEGPVTGLATSGVFQ